MTICFLFSPAVSQADLLSMKGRLVLNCENVRNKPINMAGTADLALRAKISERRCSFSFKSFLIANWQNDHVPCREPS